MKNGSYLFFSEKFIKWRMMNEEYELVLYAWDTPLRPQAEERNLSSTKGGQEGALSQRT